MLQSHQDLKKEEVKKVFQDIGHLLVMVQIYL